MKIDETVKKETLYIAGVTAIFNVLMQAIFLIIGKWEIGVLLGGLLSFLAGVGNFLLLGLTVQKAVLKEEKEAKQLMKTSQALRQVAMFGILALGLAVPVFHWVAVIVPMFFPRIAIALRPWIKGGRDK